MWMHLSTICPYAIKIIVLVWQNVGIHDSSHRNNSRASNRNIWVHMNVLQWCTLFGQCKHVCQAYNCTTGTGADCATCESQASQTADNHCATCNGGYYISGTTCQALLFMRMLQSVVRVCLTASQVTGMPARRLAPCTCSN